MEASALGATNQGVKSRGRVDAINCKWNPEAFDVNGLKTFRESYPVGRNLVIAPHVKTAYERQMGNLKVEFVPIEDLRAAAAQ
jgi:hypothetical protein